MSYLVQGTIKMVFPKDRIKIFWTNQVLGVSGATKCSRYAVNISCLINKKQN